MIQQAIDYLRGAVSSAMLVSVAVVVAVLIMVSVGTGSGPMAVLGLGGSQADPLVVSKTNEAESVRRAQPRRPAPAVRAARSANRGPAATRRNRRGNNRTPATNEGESATSILPASRPGGGDRLRDGDPAPSPTRSTPAPAPAERPPTGASSGGGRGVGGSNPPRDPRGDTGPAKQPQATSVPSDGGETSPSAGLNEGLNRTVDDLDKTLGGVLDRTGLSDTVKGTTETLVGPDSTLGKTVDGVTGGLGRLLGRR